MSHRGTDVLRTSGESKGLESGVDPRAAFTKNLKENFGMIVGHICNGTKIAYICR